MLKSLAASLLLLSLSFLQLQAGKLESINAVTLEGEVGKPGHFIYYGTTDVIMGSLFGLGAIMGGMGPDKEGSEIESRMRTAGFKVENQFRSDFQAQFAKQGLFTSGGNHKLRLDITRYGMGVAPTGFKRLKPVMEGQVTIRDGSFKQVYFLRRAVSENDDLVKGQTYEEYRDNIQLLIRDMKALSAKLAERLAETIAKDRKSSGGSASQKSTSSSKTTGHRFNR